MSFRRKLSIDTESELTNHSASVIIAAPSRVQRLATPRHARGFADGLAQRRVAVRAARDVLCASLELHDRHALRDQVRRARAENVNAQHAISFRVRKYLYEPVLLVHRLRSPGRAELEPPDAILGSLLLQLLF